MAEERFYNPNSRRYETRKTVSGETVEKAKDAESLGTTKGKNLGALGKPLAGAPKQEEGETASAFAKRFREYREERAKK